jgi:oxazoline/thiazoline synthase
MYYLNPTYQFKVLAQDRALLFSEEEHFFVRDPLCIQMLETLPEGVKSKDEKSANILNQLLEAGILLEKKAAAGFPAFWHLLPCDPLQLQERLEKQCVSIISLLPGSTEKMTSALEGVGIKGGEKGVFTIVIVNDYLDVQLKELAAQFRSLNHPWICVKPTGQSIWVGPIFNSRSDFAFVDFSQIERRLMENRPARVDLLGAESKELSFLTRVEAPTQSAIAYQIVASETLNWMMGAPSKLLDHVLTYNGITLEMHMHQILPSLQELEKPTAPSTVLTSCPKEAFSEMGERSCSTDVTYERIKGLMSPITGLISKCFAKKEGDFHIYYGPRSLPFAQRQLPLAYPRSPDVVVGKSTNDIEAQVGFIAEAAERYFCSDLGFHTKRFGTYEEMADECLPPEELLLFSKTQYAQRELWNSQASPYHWVPECFDPKANFSWTQLNSLTSPSRIKYVPSSYCYLNLVDEKEALVFPGNSNGCATGNRLEEAIVFALLELVERDAVAIWWYNRLHRPSLDLSSFHSPLVEKNRSWLKSIKRELRVIDISTDLGIPAFVALSWKEDGSRIVLGSAAHLNAQVALHRALAEHNQVMTRAEVPSEKSLESFSLAERDLVRWLWKEKISDHSFLTEEKKRPKAIQDFAQMATADFYTDIQVCTKLLERVGLEAFWLPLTPATFPLQVVRVVVPRLRHFWKRLGPGRLYDVPVITGDLAASYTEEQLNPIPYIL